MNAKRTSEIANSLAFARRSLNDLLHLIVKAQREDSSVEFIGHKTGAILQTVRQCFDYCAADLRDDFLDKPQAKVYYPFHPNSLDKGKPLHELQGTAPKAFAALLRVAKSILAREIIPNTMCNYGDLASVNRLVNDNKHDRVHRVHDVPNSRTFIKGPGGVMISVSPIYPVRPDGSVDYSKPGPVGPMAWTASRNLGVSGVKDFQFEDNSRLSRPDVHGFCMMVITATRFTLGYVYSESYGVPETIFRE